MNLPSDWVIQGGAVGLLAIGVMMLFLGWLVPWRTYSTLKQDRDYWREVALKSMGHTDALMPAAEIATQITKALSESVSKPPARKRRST